MSADNEGDSQMLSSPDEPEPQVQQRTSAAQTGNSSSTATVPSINPQPRTSNTAAMPTSASGASIANSNGKRPIQTISNGNDDAEELAAMANGKARQDPQSTIYHASGYSWTKADDAPGHAWSNKKAMDEYHRAWEVLVHKDHIVGHAFADPFEMVEQEKAIIASLK